MHLDDVNHILRKLFELVEVHVRAQITLNDLPEILAQIVYVLLKLKAVLRQEGLHVLIPVRLKALFDLLLFQFLDPCFVELA